MLYVTKQNSNHQYDSLGFSSKPVPMMVCLIQKNSIMKVVSCRRTFLKKHDNFFPLSVRFEDTLMDAVSF